MQQSPLWAPWRMDYIQQLAEDESAMAKPTGCFLCQAAALPMDDPQKADDRFLLVHDHRGLLLLNRYPYTNGHLLVAPRQHLADLSQLNPQQRHDLMDLVTLGQSLLEAAINPQGMNIGINLGRCAGAGLPGHLHVHIVPRWSGDTNFMQSVGQIRVIPQALQQSYDHLKATLEKMS